MNTGTIPQPENEKLSETDIADNEAGETSPDTSAEITAQERELLDKSGRGESRDEANLENSTLDHEDEDGEELNERIDLAGDDLDVPGAEADDDNEAIGEEDEENNSYSMSDQDDVDNPDS